MGRGSPITRACFSICRRRPTRPNHGAGTLAPREASVSEQLELFPDPPPGSIQARFLRFHEENPLVWQYFLAAARALKESGRKKFGARAIIERLRWDMPLTTSGEGYKLNDNYTSRYVRKLVEEYPEFEDLVELRSLRTE